MRRYQAILAYDGSAYRGYQRQANHLPTVQASVEQALENILHRPTTIIGAGRTDAGVHAIGQVISFDANWQHAPAQLQRALNAVLPPDIALTTLQVAPDDFHPRFSALSRTYRYTVIESPVRQPLLRERAWQMQPTLDDTQMQEGAQRLIGQHDFGAFGKPPQGDNTVRHVLTSHWHVQAQPYGRELVYEVTANAFLHHMVRRMVALMVEVGQGRITPQTVTDVLNSRDRTRAKRIAPPQGLVLVSVAYPHQDQSQATTHTKQRSTNERQQTVYQPSEE